MKQEEELLQLGKQFQSRQGEKTYVFGFIKSFDFLFKGGDFFEIDADSGKLTWKKAFTPGLDCIKDGNIFLPVTVK